MLQLMNPETSTRRLWCATLVIVAVCALALSLATRYTGSFEPSGSAVAGVRSVSSVEPARQRLIKSVASWMPVVICYAVLETPRSYPPVVRDAPLLPSLLLEQNLYNRPPPPDSRRLTS
jgi:hypothetical protein